MDADRNRTVRIETAKIEETSTGFQKVELNSEGDYITLSVDSPETFDKFLAGYKQIMDMADRKAEQIRQTETGHGDGTGDVGAEMERVIAISKINVGFSREAVQIIDGIFGEGTVWKYFRFAYEMTPDFLPDSECIIEFFEKIAPVMEKMFNRKLEKDEAARKKRMEKYQPQDHKKPVRKAASKK
ncbi:MAG: hypothetical protein NC489_19650 [Ruminococcus flavefaciens]|nr:hypothetical protein [Ruminococcus flavefaciens]